MERICGGDRERAIQIEAYNWEKSGKHKSIGKFQTSVNGLIAALMTPSSQGLELVHKGKPHGNIIVKSVQVVGGGNSVTSLLDENRINTYPSNTLPCASSTPAISEPVASNLPLYSEMRGKETTSRLSPPLVMAPPTMTPSFSSYPIAMSESASSLPPAIPPPAFDVSSGPTFGTSFTSGPDSRNTGSDSVPLPSPSRVPFLAKPTFVDYLSGGLQINLSVAIDFTGSNGDPRIPGTLHHIHSDCQQLNDYEKAFLAVGSIIARYDPDQQFPVYGFGAKYDGVVRHCFQVGGAPELKGIREVMEAYRAVFTTGLTMSGPTVFADVINHVAIKAQNKLEKCQAIGKQSYSVLLILTDGAVTDIEQTKVALKYASSAPLSIVIVGVGEDDFSKMNFLDNVHQWDDEMRDIVKFVEFSKFRHDRQALTRETLDEIPDQVVEYFHGRGILPLPPISGSRADVFEEDYNPDDDIDLQISIGDDGGVHLADSNQARWNAQSYGNAAVYLKPINAPPSFHPSVSSPYVSSGCSEQMPPTCFSASSHTTSGSIISSTSSRSSNSLGREPPNFSPYVSSISSSVNSSTVSNGPLHQAQELTTTLVMVQVPVGAYPGMQLRVQNPVNGNTAIVTVPPGVAPGSMFRARL
jgi:hypothetical protein